MKDFIVDFLKKLCIAASGVAVIYLSSFAIGTVFAVLPWTLAIAALFPVFALLTGIAIYVIWFVKGMTDEPGTVEEVLLNNNRPQ